MPKHSLKGLLKSHQSYFIGQHGSLFSLVSQECFASSFATVGIHYFSYSKGNAKGNMWTTCKPSLWDLRQWFFRFTNGQGQWMRVSKVTGKHMQKMAGNEEKKIQATETRVALAADGKCLQNSCKKWLSQGIYSDLSVTEASIHLSTFLTFYYLVWLWGFKCSPLQATETPHYYLCVKEFPRKLQGDILLMPLLWLLQLQKRK